MNHGIQEYKDIRAIYPPTEGIICKGCSSCGQDVKTENGFVDMKKEPFKGYLCARCTVVAIGAIKASMLVLFAQETYRKTKP